MGLVGYECLHEIIEQIENNLKNKLKIFQNNAGIIK